MELIAALDREERNEVADNVGELAKQLYKAGAGKWLGCSEQVFLDVLAWAWIRPGPF